MRDQAVFDLTGPNAETRRRDHVVVAADKAYIAFVIDHALIAGRHPVTDEFRVGRFLVAPVLQEHHRVRPLDRDLAGLAGIAHTAVRPDHRHIVPWHRLADRAG